MTNVSAEPSESPHVAYASGRWVEHRSLSVSADDLGFRQAVTAVERLRTYHGAPFQFDAHFDRWQATLKALGIRCVMSRAAMAEVTGQLLRRNASFCEAAGGDVGITWFATPGAAAGDQPTWAVHLSAIDPRVVADRRRRGQPLVITDVVQPPPESWPRTIKVRCRLHHHLADAIARQHAADALAVLRDTDGSLTETSIANLAVVRGGEIFSPPTGRVLDGVTQRVVQSLAESAGIRWHHGPVTPEGLRGAEEVLLMGTDTGLWFARSVDQQPIAGGGGAVYRTLLAELDRLTAMNRASGS